MCTVPERSIGFNADHPRAGRVRQLACAIAGCSSVHDTKSLLCSLNIELMFNDLRDCQKRHAKHEVSKATNLACVACRSGNTRSPLQKIELDNRDWSTDEGIKVLKASILSSAREKDKDLGVNIYNLIHERQNADLTKPHMFTRRLRLFQSLQRFSCTVPEVTPDLLEQVFSESWPANMLKVGCLWRPQEDDHENVRVVLRAGPYNVRFLNLRKMIDADEASCYALSPSDPGVQETITFRLDSGHVSAPTVVVSAEHGLLVRAEKWQRTEMYFCEHKISSVKAGVLLRYIDHLGLAGLKKVPHRERVRKVLEHHGFDNEFIEEVLSAIPVRERKTATEELQLLAIACHAHEK